MSPSPTGRAHARLALSLAVVISGAVLLGLEIAASRVLAPTFGSSLFVWGSLIGVVLAGLAIGYALAGALADRRPTLGLLIGTLAAGATLVLLIPVVDRPVIDLVTRWNAGPRLNPLLATIMLFALPSVVLAGVTPVAVRLSADSVEHLGRTAGRLFSLSTIGSIGGTFATAFWLVPELGTDQVIVVGAVCLLVAAAVLAVSARAAILATTLVVAAVACAFSIGSLSPTVGTRLDASQLENWSPIYRERTSRTRQRLAAADVSGIAVGFTLREARDTRYHRMVVVDDEDSRFLRFDNSFQSGMYLADPFRTRFAYTDHLHVALAYAPRAQRVLVIGLGGGAVPKRLWRDFPGLTVDVVELDPDVVTAARRWFELPPDDERLHVTVSDGRRFLEETDERWDVIMLDAFYADGVPFHLTTLEFIELLRERLHPGGVVATNVIGAIAGNESRLTRAIVKTYRSVFPTVELHPVYDSELDTDRTLTRNIIVVATERAAPTEARLANEWDAVRAARAPSAPPLAKAIRDRVADDVPTADVPILTDGYAPTDALLVG
ncbi:MAG: fused MFS/spermidine synthase [Gaiellales bacterium]